MRTIKTPGRNVIVLSLVVAGILLAWHSPALALNPSLDVSQYAHTSWTARDGYSPGTVFAIAQTPDGYLWVGCAQSEAAACSVTGRMARLALSFGVWLRIAQALFGPPRRRGFGAGSQ